MFFSVFFLFILFQSALANEVRSGSILENVYKHENDQKQFQKGNEKECGSALGVYDIQYGNDKKKVYFEAPHRSQLPFLDPNKNTAIFEMFSANSPKPKRTGMLISRDDKWFLIELNEGVTHPYPSIYQTTAIYAAFVEYYEKGNKNPNGVKIRELTFSSDMLKANAKGESKDQKISFKFNEMATIDKFLKETDSISSFFSRLNTQEVRIPPQMYEVIHDPEFKKAKEEKTYSKMYDIIFKKALELANGDVEKALFISLISIDLRDRGLCGAIQGPRGHTIVPLGIFDNEEMKTSVIGSRYDAAQHFFGYALLAKKFGKRAALAYSSTTKTQALAHLGRFFRDRHVGIDPDFGLDNGFKIDGGLSPTSWFQGEDLRVRPDYDKKADKLYNNMGSNFGSLISKNPRALPSQVITDPKYQPLLNEIGVPQDRSNTWSVKPKEAMIEGKTKYIYKNIGSMEFKSDKLNIPSADIENGEITFIPISNGNTINDCINHKNSKLFNLGEYTVLQLNFGDSKECQRFFKQNKQEMIIIHRNRRYHLTTNPEN